MPRRRPKLKQPQTQRIVLDIDEEGTSAVTDPDEGEMLTGIFHIRIRSDFDSALTVDLLLAAYVDMVEHFLEEHDRDPDPSPSAARFVTMHRRLFTLATEIADERTDLSNDTEEIGGESLDR